MEMLKLLSLLFLLRQTWCGSLPPFRVILVLPNITESEPQRQSWHNGWEVVPGAVSAEEIITQHFKFNMSTRRIFVTDTCTSQLPLVEFVKELTDSQEETITVAMIGLFCKDVFLELSGIAERFGLVQISCAISPPITDQNSLHYQMLPSTAVYAEALTQFMTHTGWTKIGVVYTQTSDAYYLETAEQVIKTVAEKGLTVFSAEVNQQTNVHCVLRNLEYSGIKIVYIILPPSETSLLICLAYDFDLRWPEYGWIVPDISLQDILSVHNSSSCNKESTHGIFSFKNNYTNEVDRKDYEAMEELFPSTSNRSINRNIYASVIYDSMWALALSLNQSHAQVPDYYFQTRTQQLIIQRNITQIIGRELANVSFHGKLGQVSFDSHHQIQASISIYQTLSGEHHLLGLYNPQENVTHFEDYSSSQIPSDELDTKYILLPVILAVLLLMGVVVCTILTLASMVLFVYYRNEPEIKASSYHISIFLFIACYAVCAGTLSHVIYSSIYGDDMFARNVHCCASTSSISLGFNLVFTTLLVRTLRVYRIFTYMGTLRRECTDLSLSLLILLILLGNVIILVIWAAVDLHVLKDIETYHPEGRPPYYEIVQHCNSDHSGVWLTLTFLYTGCIIVLLAVVSFKARKIHHKNFKDTKKVNALIFTYIIAICIVSTLWSLLRIVGDPIASKSIIAIGYLLIPLGCSVYLLLPKALPPLHRSLKKRILHNSANKNSRSTN